MIWLMHAAKVVVEDQSLCIGSLEVALILIVLFDLAGLRFVESFKTV
jgi:hypothetical protein